MKSLVELSKVLLLDCGRKCGAPVRKSVETLIRRVKHEGDSFITITLPSFGASFDRALAEGKLDPGSFPNFRKKKGTAGIPAFLSEFLLHVFDAGGVLLDNPSIDCISAVRQFCLFAKKILRPCSDTRMEDAIERYAQCDCEVINELPDSQLGRYFRKVASILVDDLFLESVTSSDLLPRHGPGATREHISGNQKYVHRVWHERLQKAGFGYLEFGYGSDTVHKGDFNPDVWPSLIEPGAEAPCRVVLVPKTLKTPRVIAIEPVCMQYIQQAIAELLVGRLETYPFTRGHVCFTDQRVNQELALSASKRGHLATLDMKDASDRVSLAHVCALLASSPKFLEKVLACRTTSAELPNGEVLALGKFASMGSALCFPMEAMVFYTSIIASRISRAGLFPTPATVMKYSREVYVYGDDLIVPSDEAPAVCDDLEALGFKVNRHKSFWTGKFRESCGSDCYDGSKVTSVYLRRDLPEYRGDVSAILSSVATANQLFTAGYCRTALVIRDHVDNILGPLPNVDEDSPAIGWNGFSEAIPPVRWNRNLQRSEIRCWVPTQRKHDDLIEGQPAMVKCLLGFGRRHPKENPLDDMVVSSEDHLETSPSPYGLALKRRWVPAAN